MKVFLSWSGELSHKVASAFREWLPSVIQAVVPYVSSQDIDKGTRWSTDIAKELAESSYGIICVTKENLSAPWVHFEAGALSKSIDKSNVTPFLYGIKRSEVQGPLLQFQSTVYEKDDIHKLLKSLNQRLTDSERIKDEALKKALDVWWPQLEAALNPLETHAVARTSLSKKTTNTEPADILEELLELSRNQQRILSDPSSLLPPDYVEYVLGRLGPKSPNEDKRERILSKLHHDVIDIERLAVDLARKNNDPHNNNDLHNLVTAIGKLHSNFHEVLENFDHKGRRPTIKRMPKVDDVL